MTVAAADAAVAPAAPASSAKWPAMITVMVGMLGIFLSMTMVNIAVPDVMGAYGIGQDQAHWMVTGFLSAMTVAMLLTGWFMNNIGPRRTFIGAMVIYAGASIVAKEVELYWVMVGARVVMGACAGILEPLAMATIFRVFPAEERGTAMGIFGMGVVLGPAVGPAIGGMIVDELDWRLVFVAPLPMLAISCLLATRYLPGRDPEAVPTSLNLASLALISIAMASFLAALSNGQRLGWDAGAIVGGFAIAAIATVALILSDLTSRAPLIQLKLFADRSFAAGSVVSFVLGCGLFATIYLLPILVRSVQGFSATTAGMVLLPAGMILLVVFPIAGRLAQALPAGLPIMAGFGLFAVACAFLATADSGSSYLFLALWAMVGRIGMGLVFPALTVGAFATINAALLPFAAGTLTFARMLGGALGTNGVAITVELRANHHAQQLTATQTGENPLTFELLNDVSGLLASGGVSASHQLPLAIGYLGRMVEAQAVALAFQDAFLVLVAAFLSGFLPALLLLRVRAA